VHIAFAVQISITMGCGMSTEDKEGKVRNEEIENQLKRDKLSQRNEIKMLLLGMRTHTFLGNLDHSLIQKQAPASRANQLS
jgi:hypothetical protein